MSTASTVSPIRREPKLAGQTVVVIGGSAGIGLETARLARSEGATLILAGRNPERLQHAASELGARFVDTPLSASLLGDQLDARRKQLRKTLPVMRWTASAAMSAGPITR